MTTILREISLGELCQLEEIDTATIVEVVEYDIVKPLKGASTTDWVFDTTSVYWIKKAVRIYQDFEIDWVAVAMVIDLLQKNQALQQENETIRQQIERFTKSRL